MALAADILQCTFGNDSVIPSTIAAMLNLSLSSFLAEKKFCTTVIIIQGLDNGHVFVIPERRTKEGLALLCAAATSFHNFEMGFMSRYWIHVAAFISNNEQGRACTILLQKLAKYHREHSRLISTSFIWETCESSDTLTMLVTIAFYFRVKSKRFMRCGDRERTVEMTRHKTFLISLLLTLSLIFKACIYASTSMGRRRRRRGKKGHSEMLLVM